LLSIVFTPLRFLNYLWQMKRWFFWAIKLIFCLRLFCLCSFVVAYGYSLITLCIKHFCNIYGLSFLVGIKESFLLFKKFPFFLLLKSIFLLLISNLSLVTLTKHILFKLLFAIASVVVLTQTLLHLRNHSSMITYLLILLFFLESFFAFHLLKVVQQYAIELFLLMRENLLLPYAC
jgi:hypothetical protein